MAKEAAAVIPVLIASGSPPAAADAADPDLTEAPSAPFVSLREASSRKLTDEGDKIA